MKQPKKIKVVTILGTRPEIIRLSCVIKRLESMSDHVLVHTGQNYDPELNSIFFSDLGLSEPDHYLGVDTSSLGKTLGGIFIETENVLAKEQPDAVLILGDTNSALSAYIARRMKIPIYHMEAGNRCYDRNVPEETNRKLVDHIVDFNLVYTEHARRNLLNEGLPARRIYLTGSPMLEVLSEHEQHINESGALEEMGVEQGKYFLISVHREENVDIKDNLREIVQALNLLAAHYDVPVIVSTHPRTRKRLDGINENIDSRISWLKPFGFHDYNKLQKSAMCVLSDSGTIAEESSILGFPGVTPRFSIERPEAMDCGSVIVCGCNAEHIFTCVTQAIEQGLNLDQGRSVPNDYQIQDTSQRVVNLILGTCRLSNDWDGIKILSQND